MSSSDFDRSCAMLILTSDSYGVWGANKHLLPSSIWQIPQLISSYAEMKTCHDILARKSTRPISHCNRSPEVVWRIKYALRSGVFFNFYTCFKCINPGPAGAWADFLDSLKTAVDIDAKFQYLIQHQFDALLQHFSKNFQEMFEKMAFWWRLFRHFG